MVFCVEALGVWVWVCVCVIYFFILKPLLDCKLGLYLSMLRTYLILVSFLAGVWRESLLFFLVDVEIELISASILVLLLIRLDLLILMAELVQSRKGLVSSSSISPDSFKSLFVNMWDPLLIFTQFSNHFVIFSSNFIFMSPIYYLTLVSASWLYLLSYSIKI